MYNIWSNSWKIGHKVSNQRQDYILKYKYNHIINLMTNYGC